jgi:hypothetical protein
LNPILEKWQSISPSAFIEFLLTALEDSLQEAIQVGRESETPGKMQRKMRDRILTQLREAPTLSIPELAWSNEQRIIAKHPQITV